MQSWTKYGARVLAVAPATLITAWMLGANHAAAQETYSRIQNVAAPGASLHVENGPVEVGARGQGDWSADWVIEPIEPPYVRIKNRWRQRYLHTETRDETVELGELAAGWQSMMWEVIGAGDHYRIRNRYTGLYLDQQDGNVKASPLARATDSMMWTLSNYATTAGNGCFVGDQCAPQRLVSDTALCLEANGGPGGTVVLADTCTKRSFSLNEPIGSARFAANGSIQFNGLCLHSSGPDATPTLQQCSDSPAQRWHPEGNAVRDTDGLCLTAAGNVTRTIACNNSPQQAWGRIPVDPSGAHTVAAVYIEANDSANRQRATTLTASLAFIQARWAADGFTFALAPTATKLGRGLNCSAFTTLQHFRQHTVRQLSLRAQFYLNTKYVVAGECPVEGAANADETVSVFAPWILTNAARQLTLDPATADDGAMAEVGSFGHELGHSFGLDHENCLQGGFQGGPDEGGPLRAAGMPGAATKGPMCNGVYFPNVDPPSAYQRNRLFERSCKWFTECGAGYDELGANGRPWDCWMRSANAASFKASPQRAQLQLHRFTYEEGEVESYAPFVNNTSAAASEWKDFGDLYLLKGVKNYFAISQAGAPNGQAFRCYGFVEGPSGDGPDGDDDGITDDTDHCAITPAQAAVNRSGCAPADVKTR